MVVTYLLIQGVLISVVTNYVPHYSLKIARKSISVIVLPLLVANLWNRNLLSKQETSAGEIVQ